MSATRMAIVAWALFGRTRLRLCKRHGRRIQHKFCGRTSGRDPGRSRLVAQRCHAPWV